MLQRAVAAGAPHGGVTTQLGNYLAEAGNPGAAIPLLEPLTSGEAVDADALNALGIAYARAGRRAQRTANVRTGCSPSIRRAAWRSPNLGRARSGARRRGYSARLFRARYARRSNIVTGARRAGCRFLKAGQPDAAVTAWKRAVELDSTNFDAALQPRNHARW